MKYTCLFKSLDELKVTDFDDEVFAQYGMMTVIGDTIVSYKRESDAEEVTSTVGELKEEWREKQVELILNDLSDRVADKVVEKLKERAE